MRNAALTLGLIGGLLAMFVGFFGFGYTEFIENNGEIGDFASLELSKRKDRGS